jgi:hypothetical protein
MMYAVLPKGHGPWTCAAFGIASIVMTERVRSEQFCLAYVRSVPENAPA